jgi:hypothetical protein
VIDSSRYKGEVFREVPVNSTNLEQVLADLMEDQYVELVRVVCFNVQEGWSRDMSAEVAQRIERCSTEIVHNLPKSLCRFIAKQRGNLNRSLVTRIIHQDRPGRTSRIEQRNPPQGLRPGRVVPRAGRMTWSSIALDGRRESWASGR